MWRARDVPAAAQGDRALAIRLWPGEDTLTLVSAAGVVGYGTADGEPRWEAAAPSGAGAPCAAAPGENSAGLGAVFYTAGDGGCSVLAVLDTTNGALLWSTDLAVPGRPPAAPDEVAVTVGEAAVTANLDRAGSPAGFHRFEAAGGAELPLPEPPRDEAAPCPVERRTEAIRHAGSRIVALSTCAGAVPELAAYAMDTGELQWTHPVSDPVSAFTGILAGDPVLLAQRDTNGTGDTDGADGADGAEGGPGAGAEGEELVAYSETGEELWRMPRPDAFRVAGGVLCAGFAADAEEPGATQGTGGTEDTGDTGDAGDTGDTEDAEGGMRFAGYGLVDGERRWTAELPDGTRLLGVEGDGRLLIGHTAGDAFALRRLDPADGTLTPASTVPLDGHRATDRPVVAYDDDQLYVLTAVESADAPGGEALRLRAYER
ncbi:PQQ-binding-like beta-propeller repeat protein [Streptomyces hoynatensis]|uniref:Pyrrolo-quinoline quinone repeat domain-containing protein n=1 Tax=Streptomyces hoynatensis TaxID=1141874 RepID=A0A3A9YTP3_9ACTN|nr:PQQ-binding-like beta-propeller repeat protein [Streptomyces hoynatensis]RKN39441.1 hypothetical protein D7294_20785 [Streptomyces hoynatensis]